MQCLVGKANERCEEDCIQSQGTFVCIDVGWWYVIHAKQRFSVVT